MQEALTNALKHAPGAPVHITLSGQDGRVQVQVVNDPPRAGSSGLERTGGGHGLAGMRERISHCGGLHRRHHTSGRMERHRHLSLRRQPYFAAASRTARAAVRQPGVTGPAD